jgi:Flp pilus assembly protein TadG
MIRYANARLRRPGAAIVETAVVISVFLLFLFGILEYCRFVFIKQLTANASREGARYAVVNTSSATLDADVQTQVRKLMGGMDGKVRNFVVQAYHGDASGNKIHAFDASGGSQVAYFADAANNYVMAEGDTKVPVQTDGTGTYIVDTDGDKVYVTLNQTTGTVTGLSKADFDALVASKKILGVSPATNAQFGEYIVVQIDCDYDPILPSFLLMNQTIHITTKSLMYSEGN